MLYVQYVRIMVIMTHKCTLVKQFVGFFYIIYNKGNLFKGNLNDQMQLIQAHG